MTIETNEAISSLERLGYRAELINLVENGGFSQQFLAELIADGERREEYASALNSRLQRCEDELVKSDAVIQTLHTKIEELEAKLYSNVDEENEDEKKECSTSHRRKHRHRRHRSHRKRQRREQSFSVSAGSLAGEQITSSLANSCSPKSSKQFKPSSSRSPDFVVFDNFEDQEEQPISECSDAADLTTLPPPTFFSPSFVCSSSSSPSPASNSSTSFVANYNPQAQHHLPPSFMNFGAPLANNFQTPRQLLIELLKTQQNTRAPFCPPGFPRLPPPLFFQPRFFVPKF